MNRVKKTKYFFLYFIFSFLILVLGICLLPVWKDLNVFWKNWGNNAIYLIISILLFLYFFFYLLKRVNKSKGNNIYALRIVESTIICIFALLCFINQFTGFMSSFISISRALGFAIYVRSVCGLFANYFYREEEKKYYPINITYFVMNIILVTFSTWLITANVISNSIMLWIFSISLFVIAILCIVMGIVKMPKKVKKEKKENK